MCTHQDILYGNKFHHPNSLHYRILLCMELQQMCSTLFVSEFPKCNYHKNRWMVPPRDVFAVVEIIEI